MKKRKLVSAALLSIMLLTQSHYAVNALTDPDEMSKITKLGLDLATATADKKDASEGAKEVLKKQFDDWTWNYVVGNYEKLIFQNAEAEIPAFKDKIGKLTELLEKIETISKQLGEGNYDEAAFTAIDQAVSTFDHPVVTVLWASVKLTYESHKLVKQTHAELQIETLYGTLDNDRRLRGSSSGDSPALFNINSDTVDYFFNKYIITNDSTREMVKSYVKVRLGEDFPEASSWESFKGWVLGADSAKEEELAQLEQCRNVSRRWIMTLLKDLNGQATQRYYEAKVRIELAEFQKFAAKFKHMDASIESIINEFKQINEYKKEAAKYPEISKSLSSKIAAIQAEAQRPKIPISHKKHILTNAESVYSECMKYWSRASIIGNTGYADQFKAEMTQIENIIKPLKLSMETNGSGVVAYYTSDIADEQLKSYFKAMFSGLLTEYQFKLDFSAYKEKYIGYLNSGDFKSALDVLQYTNNYNYYNGYGIEKELEGLNSHYKMMNDKANSLYTTEMNRLSNELSQVNAEIARIIQGNNSPGSLYKKYDGLKKSIEDLKYAKSAFNAAYNDLCISQSQKYQDFENEIINLYYTFKGLADERKKELDSYRAALRQIYTQLPMRIGALDGLPIANMANEPPLEIFNAKEVIQRANENSYTFIPKFTNTTAKNVRGLIYNHTLALYLKIDELKRDADWFFITVNPTVSKWENGKKQWDAMKKLDANDIEQFIVLADNGFNYKNEVEVCEIAAAKTNTYINELKSLQSSMMTKADTEILNMEKDIEYLNSILYQYDEWINEMKAQKILEDDFFPTGVAIPKDKTYSGEFRIGLNIDPATGMLIIKEPYPHYATSQELKNIPELNKAKGELAQERFYKFFLTNAPEVATYLNDLLSGNSTPAAKEENFIIGVGSKNTIWKSAIEEAELMVSKISPDSPNYYQDMKALSEKIPFLISILSKEDKDKILKEEKNPFILIKTQSTPVNTTGSLVNIDEEPLKNFPLGQKFIKLRAKTLELIQKKSDSITKKILEESSARELEIKKEYFLSEIKKIKDKLDKNFIINDEANTELYNIKTLYNNAKLNIAQVNFALDELEKYILSNVSKETEMETQKISQIKDFYNRFKLAYESQNESQLVSLVSNDWDAGDGTTISDLEENLRNTFTVFDSVSFNISNINIQKQGDNLYKVSYDLQITGKMYGNDITRDEKSTVNEQVIINKNGQIKLNKTLQGSYWYIK